MMNEYNPNTKMLGVKDLQERLQIGRDAAYALMRSKAFPSTKLGTRYRVSEAHLEKWINTYSYDKNFEFHC